MKNPARQPLGGVFHGLATPTPKKGWGWPCPDHSATPLSAAVGPET